MNNWNWNWNPEGTACAEAAGCADCQALVDTQPMLPGACASVGIEQGKSTRQVLAEYLASYHRRGHVRSLAL